MEQMKTIKLALLISGNGSTMEAIIKACRDGELSGLDIKPILVIASNKEAGGIEKALKLGIKTEDVLVIDPKKCLDSNIFGEKILEECKKREINLIGQYGWMVKTPDNVISAYKDIIINQHPGPLDNGRPDFGGARMYGMRVHEARLEFVKKVQRDFWTEATTHMVTSNFDEGKIIKRKQVPIFPNDTAEILQARVLPVEYEVQIETLRDFIDNAVIEFHREIPLILPGEEKLLEECKENAKKLYPNG